MHHLWPRPNVWSIGVSELRVCSKLKMQTSLIFFFVHIFLGSTIDWWLIPQLDISMGSKNNFQPTNQPTKPNQSNKQRTNKRKTIPPTRNNGLNHIIICQSSFWQEEPFFPFIKWLNHWIWYSKTTTNKSTAKSTNKQTKKRRNNFVCQLIDTSQFIISIQQKILFVYKIYRNFPMISSMENTQ